MTFSLIRSLGVAALAAIGAAGCSGDIREPDLDTLYAEAASLETIDRRPVISIPGTLGSRLVDRESGLVVWGGEDRLSADPDDPVEARVIALPIGAGDETLRALRDGVRPDGVVRKATASILGLPLELEVYGGVIRTLIKGGFDFRQTRREEIEEREVNLDSFEFPYDWRRDIVEAAQDLDYFITRKIDQVKAERQRVFGEELDPGDVQFDLVAHSMGGLVARYYLMYGAQDLPADGSLPELTWAGARHVSRAIFIAPPNAGSVLAFENLVNGKSFGPFQPVYHPAQLGTHIATYQLMPRERHNRVTEVRDDGAESPVDIYDVETWVKHGWGLAAPDQAEILEVLMPDVADPAERRRRAIAHLEKALKRTEQFHRAMDRPATPPDGLDVYLVVGGGFTTPASAEVDAETGEVEITGFEQGDGVVLRASSLLDERQGGSYGMGLRSPLAYRTVLFLPEEHVDITRSPVFGDNLLFWLLEGRQAIALRNPEPRGGANPLGLALGAVAGVGSFGAGAAEGAD